MFGVYVKLVSEPVSEPNYLAIFLVHLCANLTAR